MSEPSICSENEKAKVIILAGFLGSGKTTLLKRILSWETDLSDTVVIVNEFGDIGIDGLLLKNTGSDVVELTSGCVCCTMKVDLNLTLKRIWEQYNPKRIFIEATGVADPAGIMEVFHDMELREHMEVYRVITVLDADFWEVRDCFGTVFFSQLREANLILLNKIDTIDDKRVPQFLDEIHETIPHSQVVPTIHCSVDPETLWTEFHRKDFELKPDQFFRVISPSIPHGEARHYDHGSDGECQSEREEEKLHYVSFSFRDLQPLDEDCFKQFTEELPWELFRMKGPVRCQERTLLINYVGGKSEWNDWTGAEETRLVFVGWKVSAEETIRKLRKCIAPRRDVNK
jgi:G3E family GTPase